MADGKRIDLTDMAERMTQPENLPPRPPSLQEGGERGWGQPAPLAFGPGRPSLPQRPEDRPRAFEYRPGINLVSTPRAGYGLVDFRSLRNLAGLCKEVRLNVELIKRQVRGLSWDVVPVRERDKAMELYVEEIAEVKEWLETPDGVHDFDAWTNQLLEELLTVDAVTMWPETLTSSPSPKHGRGGLQVELIDGTTIVPLLDMWGRVPRPPLPAYVQVLHGVPTSYFSRERLIYAPLNAAVWSPYGSSPIEWMMLTVNLAMRRDVNHVAAFTEGNVPEALVGAPASWTQAQINTWQQYWDALTAGNVAALRRMHWVPVEGASGIPVYEFHKDDLGNTERDKWLMQVACWAYGNSPAEFGLAPGEGLGGKGYGQAMEGAQYRSMLWPAAEYLASLLTMLIQKWMGKPMLRFLWTDLEPQEDRLKQAQVDQVYVSLGVYSTAFVQERLGVPKEFRPAAAPALSTGMGEAYETTVPAVEVSGETWAGQRPAPTGYEARVAPVTLSEEAVRDLRLWRKKALRAGGMVGFESEAIPAEVKRWVAGELAKVRSVEEMKAVFDGAITGGAMGKAVGGGAAAPEFFPSPNDPAGWEQYG